MCPCQSCFINTQKCPQNHGQRGGCLPVIRMRFQVAEPNGFFFFLLSSSWVHASKTENRTERKQLTATSPPNHIRKPFADRSEEDVHLHPEPFYSHGICPSDIQSHGRANFNRLRAVQEGGAPGERWSPALFFCALQSCHIASEKRINFYLKHPASVQRRDTAADTAGQRQKQGQLGHYFLISGTL